MNKQVWESKIAFQHSAAVASKPGVGAASFAA